MNSNKNQSHAISSPRAHTRASVGFRFSPSPFTPLSHHFVPQWVRCEGKAYFFLHLFLHPRNEGKATFTEKSHFLSRRKLQKGGGFRPKVFTQNQLIHNHLRKVGEGVKAKNEKPLCAHYARERPPHLHSEHRAPHLLRPEALPPLRGAHSSSRDSTTTSPLCTPPSAPFFHKKHRQTCPPPNNSYICSTHT